MSEKAKRRRISNEEATIVDKYADERGVTKREMLEEMIRSYDSDRAIVEETQRQTEMLEELCDAVLDGTEGSVGGAPKSVSEASDGIEGDGYGELHPNNLSPNHSVTLDPEAREWGDEVIERKGPGVAAIRGFLESLLNIGHTDTIPTKILEEAIEELYSSDSTIRRYKFEYGPELDAWYPYLSEDPDFDANEVHARIIDAKQSAKTHNKGEIPQTYPTLEACFPKGDEGDTLPYKQQDIFLQNIEKRDEWVSRLVDRTIEYIETRGAEKAGLIYLSALIDYAEEKDVKVEEWRKMIREDWCEHTYWVDDW